MSSIRLDRDRHLHWTSVFTPAMLRPALVLASLWLCALGGSIGLGGNCTTENDHLDVLTHKFMSDCSDSAFCTAPNGTCQPRRCRRDEFPFGYPPDAPLPPLCPPGSFCPDEGDGCRVLVPLGGVCQLARDEQCSAPPEWSDLASPYNANGSICLHSTCTFVLPLPPAGIRTRRLK